MSVKLDNHKDNIYLTLEELQTPPTKSGIFRVYVNHYWLFIENKTILYKGKYPQCNFHASLCERYAGTSGLYEIIQVKTAYIPYREDS